MSNAINYGPLKGLIGTWKGERGIDVAPEPDGPERSPFYDVLTFEAADDVDNAETQVLSIVRYHHKVFRQSNDEQFHDQVGYFTWDDATQTITHSFVIPRGVAIVAGGKVIDESNDKITMVLKAADGDPDYGISQSPFMRDHAKTTSYQITLELEQDQLSYEQITMLDIYRGEFKHLDKSQLIRQ